MTADSGGHRNFSRGGEQKCSYIEASKVRNINLKQAHCHAAGFLGLCTSQKALEHMLERCKSLNLTAETLKI